MSRERFLLTLFVSTVALALAVLAFFGVALAQIVRLAPDVRAGGASFKAGVASLEVFSREEASAHFATARDRFRAVEKTLDSSSLRLFSNAPTMRGTFGFARSGARVAADTSDDLISLISWLDTIIPQTEGTFILSDLDFELRRAVLRTLAESPSRFASLQTHIREADALLSNVPTTVAFGVKKSDIEELKQNVSELRAAFDGVLKTGSVLSLLVGYPREASHLLLLQNNTEIRPTGGFIGTIGGLTFRNGEIASLATEGVYNLDRPSEGKIAIPTPMPLDRYGATQWLFLRDANWSPDFPTSAARIHELYLSERANASHLTHLPTNPQYIIAFTPTLIEQLLKITGPITVQGKTFAAERLTYDLEFEVEIGYASKGVPQEERKAIIGPLAHIVIAKVLDLPPTAWPVVVRTFHEAIAEGHLMVWAKDADVQKDIVANGWGGEVKQPEGDYLMVVDANLSSLKTDPAVSRTIRWKIAPNGNGFRATAIVHYDHKGTFDWKTTRYRSYTRFYVPKGSKLISSRGALDRDRPKVPGKFAVSEELGKTVFGAFISVEPGEQYDLEVTYDLPGEIVDQIRQKRYTAMIQKQLGTVGHAYEASFNFGSHSKPFSSRGVLTRDVVLTPL